MSWIDYNILKNTYLLAIPGPLTSKETELIWKPIVPIRGELNTETNETILQLDGTSKIITSDNIKYVLEENKMLNVIRLLRKVSVTLSPETTEIRVKFILDEVKSINNVVYRDIIKKLKKM
jgi:hypothetical protein